MNDHRKQHAREFALTSGTLGATSAQTLMVALLPLLLVEHAPSAVWIGAVIASEGLFSLILPYGVGLLSDRVPGGLARRFGRRNMFLMISAPVMAVGLVVAPFLGSYWGLAAVAFVFFAALRVYVTPLWALLVDSVPESRWGRVEGVRGVLHSVGLAFGLVGGGFLFDLWQPLPFLVAAALLLVTTGATFFATPPDSLERVSEREAEERGNRLWPDGANERSESKEIESGEGRNRQSASRRGDQDETAADERGRGGRGAGRSIWRELRNDAPLRWVLIAHALWTAAVDGMRPYIFIFASVVLGVRIAEASALLLVLFAGLAIGAFSIGWLSDRINRPTLLFMSALLLGVTMCTGVFVRSVPVAIALLLPVGLSAAALISLPYPLFATLVRDRPIGEFTGVFGWAVGLAQLFPPVIVGAAVDLGAGLFPEERGYPMMWPVVGVMALLGAASLYRITRLPNAPAEVRELTLRSRQSR